MSSEQEALPETGADREVRSEEPAAPRAADSAGRAWLSPGPERGAGSEGGRGTAMQTGKVSKEESSVYLFLARTDQNPCRISPCLSFWVGWGGVQTLHFGEAEMDSLTRYPS